MRNANRKRPRHVTRDRRGKGVFAPGKGFASGKGFAPCLRGINNAILIYNMREIIISIND